MTQQPFSVQPADYQPDPNVLAVYDPNEAAAYAEQQAAIAQQLLYAQQQQQVATAPNAYQQLGLHVPTADAMPRRLVVSIAGFEKTGKTHLALTGRPPVVMINLDMGDEGVVEKFQSAGKEVYTYNIELQRPTSLVSSPDGASPEIWKRSWIDLNAKLEQVYALRPGTVIIDTMTEVYELARLAHFGKTDQVMPQRYGAVFAEMKAMIRQAYAAENTTTAFIHKMGTNFDTKVPEVKGWNQMPFMVQVNLRNDRTPPEKGYGLDNYYTVIKDSRQNPYVNGYPLSAENFSLQYLEWLILDYRPQ